MRAFWKTVLRMFKENKGRFVANFLIVLLSIMITSGLAALCPVYLKSFATNYENKNVPDVILKEKTGNGFYQEDIDYVKKDEEVSLVKTFMSLDYEIDGVIYRIYITDLQDDQPMMDLVEGSYPSSTYDFSKPIDVVAEKANNNRIAYTVGEEVSIHMDLLEMAGLSSISMRVTGIVDTPMYNSAQKENASITDDEGEVIEDKYVDSIIYLDRSLLPETFEYEGMDYPVSNFLVDTDMYIVYSGEKEYFSDAYQKRMEAKAEALEAGFGTERVASLTLEENVSYALFKNYNAKVQRIAYIFPFFFILVCALVNLITITRLIKDERSMIGTYVSLGISKGKIVLKFTLFSLISTIVGAGMGMGIGIPLVPVLVLPAYASVFEMGPLPSNMGNWFAYLCAVSIVVVSLLVTVVSSLSYLRESPSSLMKVKSPKPGKKILLQRIPILWNHLSFRFKSSFRNIFRQKKNLILTSLSIVGSTLLVLIGFALLDVSGALVNDSLFGDVASSMGAISAVIIVFAISMAVVVIYSLANMNIAERQRELATLKVLGYHDVECSMYTFREIMIISLFAVIVGLPLSSWVVAFVFDYLEFGSISDVKWYSYLFTFLILIGTTMIVNWLLYPKIKNVDMNDSLKTLD